VQFDEGCDRAASEPRCHRVWRLSRTVLCFSMKPAVHKRGLFIGLCWRPRFIHRSSTAARLLPDRKRNVPLLWSCFDTDYSITPIRTRDLILPQIARLRSQRAAGALRGFLRIQLEVMQYWMVEQTHLGEPDLPLPGRSWCPSTF
jgi:hypothetical protein